MPSSSYTPLKLTLIYNIYTIPVAIWMNYIAVTAEHLPIMPGAYCITESIKHNVSTINE